MTLYGLLGVFRRRWYVLALVIAATAAAGVGFARDGGLYVTRTLIAFDAPDSGAWEDGGSADRGIIVFASAVATEVNGGRSPLAYSTADAPFYGAGIRQGVRVAVPDTGGQWEVVYNKAAITIDAVSPNRQWVLDQQRTKVAAVLAAASARQASITPANRIAVSVAPLSETIEDVVPSRVAQSLAAAALGVVALLVGGWLAVAWDRRASAGGRRPGGVHGLRRLLGGRERT